MNPYLQHYAASVAQASQGSGSQQRATPSYTDPSVSPYFAVPTGYTARSNSGGLTTSPIDEIAQSPSCTTPCLDACFDTCPAFEASIKRYTMASGHSVHARKRTAKSCRLVCSRYKAAPPGLSCPFEVLANLLPSEDGQKQSWTIVKVVIEHNEACKAKSVQKADPSHPDNQDAIRRRVETRKRRATETEVENGKKPCRDTDDSDNTRPTAELHKANSWSTAPSIPAASPFVSTPDLDGSTSKIGLPPGLYQLLSQVAGDSLRPLLLDHIPTTHVNNAPPLVSVLNDTARLMRVLQAARDLKEEDWQSFRQQVSTVMAAHAAELQRK